MLGPNERNAVKDARNQPMRVILRRIGVSCLAAAMLYAGISCLVHKGAIGSKSVLAGLHSAFRWELVTGNAAFTPRDTASSFVFDNRMWLSNGYYDTGIFSRDLWSSADGSKWDQISNATPYDPYSEMVVFHNKVWAVKGSVWNSSNGNEWSLVLAQTPFGIRSYGHTVVFRDKLWQLGSGADVWSSSDGISWTLVTAAAPYGARFASGVAVFNNKLWLLGGVTKDGGDPPGSYYPFFTSFNDVWSSSDGSTWQRVLAEAPWSRRLWFCTPVFDSRLWVIGGYQNKDDKNLGDAWYSADGVTWNQLTISGRFSDRHEPCCVNFNGALWVIAGNSWPVTNDVWKLITSN